MALNQEQLAKLRQMSPDNRRTFHLNRIATSLEAIQAALMQMTPRPKRNEGIASVEDLTR